MTRSASPFLPVAHAAGHAAPLRSFILMSLTPNYAGDVQTAVLPPLEVSMVRGIVGGGGVISHLSTLCNAQYLSPPAAASGLHPTRALEILRSVYVTRRPDGTGI
ncbi:hypothetical protein VTO73DRAFT_10226 [Trametes versicolor]